MTELLFVTGRPIEDGVGRVFRGLLRTAGLSGTHKMHELTYGAEPLPKANAYVALGWEALQWFTGEKSMQQHRGHVMAGRNGEKVIPTMHPEDILKQWALYTLVAGDIIKAVREGALGPQIIRPKRTLYLEPNVSEVTDYLRHCVASDLLSFDIETGWGQITCIGFAPSQEEAMCIPFTDMRKPDRSYWGNADDELVVWKAIRDLLGNPDVPKLAQNGLYDVFWLWEKWRVAVRGYADDTRLMHHVLYPELQKSLEFMSSAYSQQGVWKNMGHSNATQEKRDD